MYFFVKKEWRKLLLLLCMLLLYFFSYFQRVAVPGTCFDELQRDFNTTAAAITALGSIFLYIYAIAQFFIGTLADRFGGRRTMLAGAGILACASILFPLSHSLPMLYLTRAFLAAGASTIFISLVKEIDGLFNPRHFAMWLGVSLFFGYSGGLAGTYPFERAVSNFGWRDTLFGVGLLCLAALIMATIVFRTFRVHEPQRPGVKENYMGAVLRNKLSYPIAIAGAINFTIYFLFQGPLGKKMLTDCCAISSAKAASITFAMMLLSMIFASLAGFISRIIGNRRKPVILAGVFLTLAAVVLMALMAQDRPDYRVMETGLLLLGVASFISPIILTSAKEVNLSSAAATSMSLTNFAAYVGVALVTNLAGVVMDCFKEQSCLTDRGIIYPVIAYRMIFAGCAGLAVISAIAAFFIRETRGMYAHEMTQK